MSSPTQHTLVYTLRLAILGERVGDVCVVMSSTRRHRVMGGRGLRPCVLYGGGAGLRLRRNGGRSHLRHRRMLQIALVECKRAVSKNIRDVRFSPVWLYMCVWSELGRVNRLSQILHLCFFWLLEETLELNWPIIDEGAGGRLPPMSPEGRGSVRELGMSTDSLAEL